MTSATDELRRLLDERGVEYQKLNEYVTWVFLEDRAITFFSNEHGVSAEVSYPRPVLNGTEFLTPEQATAATLGMVGSKVGSKVCGGKLTAEQVEKAIHDCSAYASYDGVQYYASGIRLQAIADELSAALGGGECEPKWTLQGTTQTQEFWRCDCGNCGYEFGVEDRRSSPWSIVVNSVDIPNYCPECGMKQKAVKR